MARNADHRKTATVRRGCSRTLNDGGRPVIGSSLGHVLVLILAAGCTGRQSALDPAGRDAETLAELFYWMAGAAIVIWLFVSGAAVYAVLGKKHEHPESTSQLFIMGGGAIFPAVVLAGLLTYGLSLMPSLLAHGDRGAPHITVSGEQWWWRVRYTLGDGREVELANELYLPLDRRVELELTSPDVIHSLWFPSLGGKVDMIPGRVNRMALEPTRKGVYRGVCAEYCGLSHAKMTLEAVVLEPHELASWLEAQLAPAKEPAGGAAKRGQALFLSLGCGACHTVRGTPAVGKIGPDLTHVGGRVSVGLTDIDNDLHGFARWLTNTSDLKPGVHMPTFDMLADKDLRALAAYLEGLE